MRLSVITYVLYLVLIVVVVESRGRQKAGPRIRARRIPTWKIRFGNAMDNRSRNVSRVCYDLVGCFDLPKNPRSPLQRTPENPSTLDTKFYLFRRNINFSRPEVLHYNDNGTSLANSSFNHAQPVKVFIHGYTGKWDNVDFLKGTNAYLKIYDCNVILMDWSTAARGPQYATAAANTEVAGRQMAVLLREMIRKGLHLKGIHLIGFSLGAHVAACASEFLKADNYLIGRITGLDASSPLFRHHNIREKSKKLDKDDALFVDVLHTDASPVFVDGFGLWDPIGHVDFFANGGQEQPGCVDRHPSVVVTHFEGTLSRDTACSHVRSLELFLETIVTKSEGEDGRCEFVAYKCPGGFPSFQNGQCFPRLEKAGSPLAIDLKYKSDMGVLGEDASGNGVMYFSTRSSNPFCGTQLQASVGLSQTTPPTVGVLILFLQYENGLVKFEIPCDLTDTVTRNVRLHSLTTADYNSLNSDARKMQAVLKYVRYEFQNNQTASEDFEDVIKVESVGVRDMYGNTWQYHGEELNLRDDKHDGNGLAVLLKKKK